MTNANRKARYACRDQTLARQRQTLGIGARRRAADQLNADLRELTIGSALWSLIPKDRTGITQTQGQRLILHTRNVGAQDRSRPLRSQRQITTVERELIDLADQFFAQLAQIKVALFDDRADR
jgi:hypothetical protein